MELEVLILPCVTYPDRLSAEHLTKIRHSTDWRRLFEALGILRDSRKSKDRDWWGKSPFKPTERTASFHMNDRGWYCHSTGQGGGPIELVQQLHPGMTCYEAGRWLLEHRVGSIVAEVREDVQTSERRRPEEAKEIGQNLPIRQDLTKLLSTGHPTIAKRGISAQVLEQLGAGYLDRPSRKNAGRDPINQRLVFQIRGLRQDESGHMRPVILGHTGRATTAEQEERDGKWWTYAGFKKSLELYNIDLAVLEDEAIYQAADTDHVIIVEGCFDIAKLRAAGICNAVATFGAHLAKEQVSRLDLISELLGVDRFLLWYDRDQDGSAPSGRGAVKAAQLICTRGYQVELFDWDRHFASPQRPAVPIPSEITDPAEFSVRQLQWLRIQGVI